MLTQTIGSARSINLAAMTFCNAHRVITGKVCAMSDALLVVSTLADDVTYSDAVRQYTGARAAGTWIDG